MFFSPKDDFILLNADLPSDNVKRDGAFREMNIYIFIDIQYIESHCLKKNFVECRIPGFVRKYHDETGSGKFKDDADVPELQRRIQALLDGAAKTELLKPKRATRRVGALRILFFQGAEYGHYSFQGEKEHHTALHYERTEIVVMVALKFNISEPNWYRQHPTFFACSGFDGRLCKTTPKKAKWRNIKMMMRHAMAWII